MGCSDVQRDQREGAEPLSWVIFLGNELLDVNTGGLFNQFIMGNLSL